MSEAPSGWETRTGLQDSAVYVACGVVRSVLIARAPSTRRGPADIELHN